MSGIFWLTALSRVLKPLGVPLIPGPSPMRGGSDLETKNLQGP
ncbi:MAG: hypothetical protein ACKO96_34075 [Flammeovirgaceae bacterium]